MIFVLLGATINVSFAQEKAPSNTKAASLRYLEVDSSLNYDLLETQYSEDATFWDPTGEVFNGDVAQGLIKGASRIAGLQKGWGLSGIDFKPEVSFYVGEYAVHRGTYKARFDGSKEWVSIPFVTIHRVVEGKIKSRMDFGEYIQSFGLGTQFDDATASTKQVSEAYLAAYLSKDFDAQAILMADNVMFQDPTASAFSSELGQAIHGNQALITNRKQVFQSISDFGFDIEEVFVSNHHAVVMGQVKYTVGNGMSYKQPAVFVIEVRDGKVTRHWDFVDYTVGAVGN